MTESIQSTSNYEDLSTETGFQFEFKCDCCNAGSRSTFDSYALGNVSNVLEGASSLFGGIFSSASNVSENVKSAKWEKDHDEAFVKAAKEISPQFRQCPKCKAWVCREKCWNEEKGLCKNCAPDLGVEMAAAQASKSKEEIWAHAAMSEDDKKLSTEDWRKGVVGSCPKCEKPLAKNFDFCPECGFKLRSKDTCSSCQAKLATGSKFCPECGEKA